MPTKTVIVTGASRGIGLAAAKYLLRAPQSSNVVVISRTPGPLQQLKEQYGKQVEVLTGDVTDSSLAQKAVDVALKTFGGLDGLVLNHGTLGQVGKVAENDPEQWRQGFDVNFISLIAFVKAGMPALRKSKGKIIFTSSGAAVSAYKGWGLYGATKAAMNHLALTLGEEEPDVTSVSIRPGVVDTEMQRELREDHATNLEPDVHAKFATAHKDGKLLKPEQPGHVIAKLALDAPKTLSGQFLSWNDKDLQAFQE